MAHGESKTSQFQIRKRNIWNKHYPCHNQINVDQNMEIINVHHSQTRLREEKLEHGRIPKPKFAIKPFTSLEQTPVLFGHRHRESFSQHFPIKMT